MDVGKKIGSLRWGISNVENWVETGLFAEGFLRKDIHRVKFRNGMRLLMTRFDMAILRELLKEDCYRQKAGFGPGKGGTVVDVGANVGIFTVLAAWSGAGHVVAVEPEERNFRRLEDNVRENGLRNVTAMRKAMGPRPGKATLHVHKSDPVMHSTRKSELVDYAGQAQTVDVITLREVMGLLPGGKIDLLKIDAEGIEHDIIGGLSYRDAGKIRKIVMESHERKGADERTLERKLASLGYEVSVKRIDSCHAYMFAEKRKPI